MALTAAQKRAAAKAETIDAKNDAAAAAYQAARVAPAKTKTEADAINAKVQEVTEATGNVYNPKAALTVSNQATLNPNVLSENNLSSGTSKNTWTIDTSAFDEIRGILTEWGLGGLADTVSTLLSRGYTGAGALNKLKYDSSPMDPNNPTGPKWNDAYSKRFAGNAARVKQGLNALDERTYLAQEDLYEATIKSYGLNNMLSTDAEKNHEKWADYMAKGISGEEFSSRIKTAFDEVLNLDPRVKENFQTWYPSLTNQDLVSYFLAPEETIDKLKTKAAAAQIGAAANMQGLVTDKDRAEMFAKRGVTYKEAQEAFSNVAEVLPAGKKLSDIYAEEMVQYSQKTAEDEYLGQSAEAKLKRNRLASKERAMFSGQAGTDSGSLVRGSFGAI